ncbi:MAG: SBBP repeat-containing protein [Ignavibacteriota bacterium]
MTDTVNAIAVDAQGNTYVTGETTSGNFPIVGGSITSVQGAVVYSFITKYNAAGTAILYSPFLGGASNTRGYAIAVDPERQCLCGRCHWRAQTFRL